MVELALVGVRAHSGAGRDCSGSRCRLLDLLLETWECSAGCAARDGFLGGLQAGPAIGAGTRARGAEMKAMKIVLAFVAVAAMCSTAYAESRRIMGGSAGGNKYQFSY